MESLTSLRNQLQQKEKEIEERKKAAKEKAFEDGCWEGMTDAQRETWREHFELMYDDDDEEGKKEMEDQKKKEEEEEKKKKFFLHKKSKTRILIKPAGAG